VRIELSKPLFAWECLEDSPSLKTVKRFLESVPDGPLLEGLRRQRGRGRNDYPVHVLWGVVILTPLLRHTSIESCLGELRRNAGLRRLIGIEWEEDVPKKWNVSRFLDKLGSEPHLGRLQEIFGAIVKKLGRAVPDLGRDTAGDSTWLHGRRKSKAAAVQEEQTEGLPQAAGGRKEYEDDDGQVTKVVQWFGYKLHLLVDVKHEVALAYEVTSTKAGDGETLRSLLNQAQDNLPSKRIATLAYDKAADNNPVHRLLSKARIKPLIQNRSLWREESEKMLPGHDGTSNVVYDEAGTLHCYDRSSDPMIRHRMSYIGHEPSRGTLKYRCPARHEGWTCPNDRQCNAGRKYGKTVRVDRTIDLRRFPPIPRATKKFERMYKGRTSVERVNARLKLFWGVDDGNITGARRFSAFVGVVMAVHAGLAVLLAATPRRDRTLATTRLSPIQRALQTSAAP
jgi:hypothetical protein